MAKCVVRWRPSGGRGEYEVVPGHALVDRRVVVRVAPLGIDIPAEVSGKISQGKPRLRKDQPNDRSKLHLTPLVMAVACLPDPAREDKSGTVHWPLTDKSFIVSEMEFDILDDNGTVAILAPLSARVLHSDRGFDLKKRLENIAADIAALPRLASAKPALAAAIEAHRDAVMSGVNSDAIRQAADEVIAEETAEFGETNAAAISTIMELPPTPLEEDIKGKEGRFLTRLHSYRERDRSLIKKAKAAFKAKHKRLYCECCGFEPTKFYGARGEDRIQAHHRTPVEELVPDSETTAEDLAMVCPNCHDIIHAKRPWISVEELHEHLLSTGNHYFTT